MQQDTAMIPARTGIIKILFVLYSEKYWSLYRNTIFVHTNRFKHVPYTYILCKNILHHTQWRKH